MEIAIALGMVVIMAGLAALVLVPVGTLLLVGSITFGVGFLVGVPTGIVYHVRLYQCLKPRDQLDKNWIWHPLQLHDRLLETERKSVLAWGVAGGVGFLVLVIGMVVFAAGIIRILVGV